MQPKVSIVIPAYNEEEWIEKTLQAALAQNYPDFEVLVIDNNSKDRTAEVVGSFGDPRLRLVKEERQGLPFARERGRLEAQGEILAQLDADCLPHPEWLARGVAILMKKNTTVSVSGPYDFHDYGAAGRKALFLISITSQGALNFFGQLFGKHGFALGGNTILKKSALDKAGGYNTKITFYGEDGETGRILGRHGKTRYSVGMACKSSARRFKQSGFLRTSYLYLKNNGVMLFINKKALEDDTDNTVQYEQYR